MKYNELIALMPSHSLEDFPTELGEQPAASLLNSFSILWHPAVIGSMGATPRWERADDALPVLPNRLVVVPLPCQEMVPPTWIERARREGATIIAGEHDRKKMLDAALAPLEPVDLDPELIADFLALGTAHLQTELLTRHMRNFSHLDEVHMQREALAAARAALAHETPTARKHLGHCFEMLLECRERFYPVDCYLIDLCLVNPDQANDHLAALLESDVPFNLLAQVCDWREIVSKEPVWQERIRSAVERQSAELIGGEDRDLPTPLMALDSTLWQLHAGRRGMQELFDATPATWGRRRFGVGAHLPQILDRMGYKAGLHFVMDDGIYPDEEQTQLRWEGADGTAIDAFSRIPLAGDSASSMIRFAVRMAESMDYDQTAAVVFARWPELRTPWMNDFRRASRYGPVLGKFVRFADFFQNIGSPGRFSDFKAGAYFTPNLVHAVARQEPNPLGRFVDYWDRRRRFERADWCRGMAHLLTKGTNHFPTDDALERIVEAAHPEADVDVQQQAEASLQQCETESVDRIREALTGTGVPGEGLLILNPLSFGRKVLVDWPAGSAPADAPEVLHRQMETDRSRAIVQLPPSGFVWLKSQNSPAVTSPGKTLMAEDLWLRNDFFEVQLSDVTGGIAQIRTYQRSPNRVSQQVAYRFPTERTVTVGEGEEQETYSTFYSAMLMRETRILSQGPAVGAIETLGDLLDQQSGKVVATYRQVTSLVRGRPVVTIDLEISTAKTPTGDPWTNYIGCRFAWKHTTAALTGSMQQGAHAVTGQRIEAPQYLEIADDDFRTTILSPGLPFHRKTGERMLDTLLITEGETRRTFQFEIAVDSKYPMQSSLDAFAEPIVVRTATVPASGSQPGWFFNVGAANVLMTRLLPRSDGGNGFVVRLLETEGKSKVFPFRSLYPPQLARQVNFLGQTIGSLKVDGDTVQIEIAPYEICDVELTF